MDDTSGLSPNNLLLFRQLQEQERLKRETGMTEDALKLAAQMADIKRIQDERLALFGMPAGIEAIATPEVRRLAEHISELERLAGPLARATVTPSPRTLIPPELAAEVERRERIRGMTTAVPGLTTFLESLPPLPRVEFPAVPEMPEIIEQSFNPAAMFEAQREARIRLAEDEERARIRVREEHEASKRSAAPEAPANPPPPQHIPRAYPTAETTAERNERWLLVFDNEARMNPKGAQARAIRRIVKDEPVTEATAKRGVQDAEKARAARYRGSDSGGKKQPAHPFDMVKPPKTRGS
jgi:hypothetical protein